MSPAERTHRAGTPTVTELRVVEDTERGFPVEQQTRAEAFMTAVGYAWNLLRADRLAPTVERS